MVRRAGRRSGRAAGRSVDPVRLAAIAVLERWIHRAGLVEELLETHERREADLADWTHTQRRRVREIAFSCVRLRARYDFALDLRRDARKPPPPRLRALLWVALHELVESRVPAHAVVDQAVEAARASDLGWAAGFVNGVLRSVSREGIERGFPRAEQDPIAHASTWWSHPMWLVERWSELLGTAEMLELCAADNRRPELCLRAAPGRREQLRGQLQALEWDSAAVEHVPDAVALRTRVPPALLFDQIGEPCVLQDPAAQLVAPILAASLRPDARVLDLCAAPGGKATHLAQLLGERCRVIAADRSHVRLRALGATLARLRVAAHVWPVVADGRRPGLLEGGFDGVLVDAPCTGTGVLARRHDARWLRSPEDLVQLPLLQSELLHRALDLVRPGGVVVYATCSLEREENDEVVDSVLASRDDVVEIGVDDCVPESMRRAGRMQTWPQRHAMDGAFAARLRRTRGASAPESGGREP